MEKDNNEHENLKKIINDFVESGQIYSYTATNYYLLLLDDDVSFGNNFFKFYIINNQNTYLSHEIYYSNSLNLNDNSFFKFGNSYISNNDFLINGKVVKSEDEYIDLFNNVNIDKLNFILKKRIECHQAITFDQEFKEFFIKGNMIGSLEIIDSFLNTLNVSNFEKLKLCDALFNYNFIKNISKYNVKDILMLSKEEKDLIELNTDIVIPEYLLNSKLNNKQKSFDF